MSAEGNTNIKGESNKVLRRGCSLYFVIPLFIVLVVLTMKHLSVSQENSELLDDADRLRDMVKSGTERTAKAEMSAKELESITNELRQRVSSLESQVSEKSSALFNMEKERNGATSERDNLRSQVEAANAAKAECEENTVADNEQLTQLHEQVKQLGSELAIEKAKVAAMEKAANAKPAAKAKAG